MIRLSILIGLFCLIGTISSLNEIDTRDSSNDVQPTPDFGNRNRSETVEGLTNAINKLLIEKNELMEKLLSERQQSTTTTPTHPVQKAANFIGKVLGGAFKNLANAATAVAILTVIFKNDNGEYFGDYYE